MANVEWRRGHLARLASTQLWNTTQVATIAPGESVLRVRWGIQLVSTPGNVSGWPMENLVTKAGILYDVSGVTVDTADTPISQPGSDWLDQCFLPWRAMLDTETGVNSNWCITGQVQQREARERRDNPAGAATSDAVYLCWEGGIGAPVAGIAWRRTGTVDVLVLMP